MAISDIASTQCQTLELMAGYFGWGGLAADFGATEEEMQGLFQQGLIMRRTEPDGTVFWSISNAGMRAVEKKGKKVRG